MGVDAFRHTSRINQDAVSANAESFEVMDIAQIGAPVSEARVVIEPSETSSGFQNRLTELGFGVSDTESRHLYENFQRLSERRSPVFDDDLIAMVAGARRDADVPPAFAILNLEVTYQNGMSQARVTLKGVADGVEKTDSATGAGSVHAVFRAVERIVGKSIDVVSRESRTLGEGVDSQTDASVALWIDERPYLGRGVDMDSTMACTLAYLNAVSRWKAKASTLKSSSNARLSDAS